MNHSKTEKGIFYSSKIRVNIYLNFHIIYSFVHGVKLHLSKRQYK